MCRIPASRYVDETGMDWGDAVQALRVQHALDGCPPEKKGIAMMHGSVSRALLLSVLVPSVGLAQNLAAPPRFKMAAPQPSAVGRPIGIPAKLGVQIVPAQQTVIIGAPVTLSVHVTAVAVGLPIVLTAQTSSLRSITVNPPQLPSAGGSVTLTLHPAENEQPSSHTLQVQATAGSLSAQSVATLSFGDPDCGSGPPVLSFSVPKASWGFQVTQKPGPASVRLRVINTGGRLPSPLSMRVFRVGSDCRYGSCINGPLLPNGMVSTLEVPLRGGCARTLYDADIAATSSVAPMVCRPGTSFTMAVNAQVQLVGAPELQGGPNLALGCSSVTR